MMLRKSIVAGRYGVLVALGAVAFHWLSNATYAERQAFAKFFIAASQYAFHYALAMALAAVILPFLLCYLNWRETNRLSADQQGQLDEEHGDV